MLRNSQHSWQMSIVTRKATHEDIPWMLVELKKFADFFGSKLSLFNPATAADVLKPIIDHHVFLVAVKADEPETRVGLVAGLLSPHFLNTDIIQLTELFWWVPEEYRGTKAGLLLFNDFVRIGMIEADWVNFTLEEKSPVKEEFLLKRGFKAQERAYLLEV